MEFLKNTIEILNKPFPEYEDRKVYYRNALAVAIFVVFFLYVFKPFDLSEIQNNRFLVCMGFGLMTFLATILFDLILKIGFRLFKIKSNLTFGKWIIQTIGVVLAISLANFLYLRFYYFGYVNWTFFPIMIKNTFAIGIFPVVTLGAAALFRQEKKFQTIAAEINQSNNSLKPNPIKNDQRIFNILIHQIQYVEALQNYVKIAYFNEHGELKKHTERATLKSILETINGSSIVKCHRSFLVNQSHIQSISGNAQGLLLSLSKVEKQIPVSRSFVPIFRT